MDQIIKIDDLKESPIKQNIENFLQELYSKFPKMFLQKDTRALQHDDSVEVEVKTNGQQMLGYLIDDFTKKMGLKVFYIVKQDYGATYYSILYSMPVEREMYVLYMTSRMYGVINSVTAQFFESIDIMYEQMLQEDKNFRKIEGDVIEKQPVRDMINNFF